MFSVRGVATAAVLAAIVFGLCSSAALGTPVQWTVAEGGNGHWYEAVPAPQGINWTDAETAAEAAGGYLATITAESENTFIFNLVTDVSYWYPSEHVNGPWIGGYQPVGSAEPAGEWSWVTGEPWGYANWAVNEPDNASGNQQVLSFFSWDTTPRPTWDDNSAAWAGNKAYIIEYVPEPATLSLLALGGLGMLMRRRSVRG
jgi:hypothetical protein